MFELVERLTLRRRCARAIDLGRCEALTRAQRLQRAACWALAGAIVAIAAGSIYVDRAFPPDVTVLQPAEFRGEFFRVVRFRFAHGSAETSCFAVLYHESQTWSVECP